MQSGQPPLGEDLIPLPHIPAGSPLKHFLSEWYTVMQDTEIIQMVKGMHIDCTGVGGERGYPIFVAALVQAWQMMRYIFLIEWLLPLMDATSKGCRTFLLLHIRARL